MCIFGSIAFGNYFHASSREDKRDVRRSVPHLTQALQRPLRLGYAASLTHLPSAHLAKGSTMTNIANLCGSFTTCVRYQRASVRRTRMT